MRRTDANCPIIHHEAIASRIREDGLSAVEVSEATGIALPKVLRLMGLAGARPRACDELDGIELVQLCMLVGLSLASVVDEGGRDDEPPSSPMPRAAAGR